MLFQISEDEWPRQCLGAMALYLHLKSKSFREIAHKPVTQEALSLPAALPALLSCLLFGILTVLSPGNIFIVFHRKRCNFFFFFDRETIFHLKSTQEYFLNCHYPSAFIICLQSIYNYLTYFALLLACIYFLSPLLECKPSKSHDCLGFFFCLFVVLCIQDPEKDQMYNGY